MYVLVLFLSFCPFKTERDIFISCQLEPTFYPLRPVFNHPSPAGKPSQISSQSYRQRAPGGGVVSGSISKLSNSTTISDILGAKIMKVQSRLLGYFSGKPGVLMTPLGAVKFLEHSGPARREDGGQLLNSQDVFGQRDGGVNSPGVGGHVITL